MNHYATLAAIKTELGITGTASDTKLFSLAEHASRIIDDWTGRFFYSKTETKYFDGSTGALSLPDLLSITTFKADTDGGRVYTDETWATTDYELEPWNRFPKWRLTAKPDGVLGLSTGERRYEIAGAWGYGDGENASPFSSAGVPSAVATVADTTSETITIATEGTLAQGDTFIAGTEQMFMRTAVSSGSATCTRAVNGTTAAAQSTAAITVAAYPLPVVRACIEIVADLHNAGGSRSGLSSERIGDYFYQKESGAGTTEEKMSRMLGPYKLLVVA